MPLTDLRGESAAEDGGIEVPFGARLLHLFPGLRHPRVAAGVSGCREMTLNRLAEANPLIL